MEQSFAVRRVTAADGPLIRAIRLRALRTDPKSFGSTYEREAEYDDARWVDWAAGDAAGDEGATFLAFEGDVPVGIVVGARREDERDVFDVFAMWVAPEARRRHVGRSLLDTVEQWMVGAGGRVSALSVTTAAPAARRLYERAGYEPTGWSGESRHTPGLVEVGYRKTLRSRSGRL
jgi:GNAT superfamily N-acetyltransferase